MRLMELIQSQITREAIEPLVVASVDYGHGGDIVEQQIAQVADFMKANCAKWLAETDGGRYTFFRGRREDTSKYLAFIKPVRTDRDPRDSIPLAHYAYNAMIDAVGGTANRSNSIFATSHYHDAHMYSVPDGMVSVIVPIGDYSYTWSRRWDDWNVESIEGLEKTVSRYLLHVPNIQEEAERAWEEEIDELRRKAEDTFTSEDQAYYENQIEALESHDGKFDFIDEYRDDHAHDEHMFSAYSDPNNYHAGRLREIILVNQQLSLASEMKHEVMIHCDKALYINSTFYQQVWPALGGEQ